MENRRNRTSEKLASAKAEFPRLSSSRRAARNATDGNDVEEAKIEPNIEINFEKNRTVYLPGDFLICEYMVELPPDFEFSELKAIETSVIFVTEGKGEEDIGVHFFERRQQRSLTGDTFKQTQRLSTVLPASPLTYDGEILNIHWCVRVRLFLEDGHRVTQDKLFRLGTVEKFETPKAETQDGDA